jgi:hypothetical protein
MKLMTNPPEISATSCSTAALVHDDEEGCRHVKTVEPNDVHVVFGAEFPDGGYVIELLPLDSEGKIRFITNYYEARVVGPHSTPAMQRCHAIGMIILIILAVLFSAGLALLFPPFLGFASYYFLGHRAENHIEMDNSSEIITVKDLVTWPPKAFCGCCCCCKSYERAITAFTFSDVIAVGYKEYVITRDVEHQYNDYYYTIVLVTTDMREYAVMKNATNQDAVFRLCMQLHRFFFERRLPSGTTYTAPEFETLRLNNRRVWQLDQLQPVPQSEGAVIAHDVHHVMLHDSHQHAPEYEALHHAALFEPPHETQHQVVPQHEPPIGDWHAHIPVNAPQVAHPEPEVSI